MDRLPCRPVQMTSPSSANQNESQTPSSKSQPAHSQPFYTPAPPLASSRYNRQLLIPQISLSGQQRISRAKVLIIGLGGLGSPAALYLAGAGVQTLGLLDHDVVERSNLHRQIAHRESSLGDSKVQSALRSCQELNREVNYVAHEVRIAGTNALDIIRDYDIVLDCTDNPATRYLISDCCVVLGKTLVSGAAQKLEGQIVALNWPTYNDEKEKGLRGRGPCYRCIFPYPPSPEMVKSCSEIGILGPVVGAIGTLMASETIRLIVRDGEDRKSTMLLYNAWPSDPRSMFRVIGLRSKKADCVACGENEAIKHKGLTKVTEESIRDGSTDYESWCGRAEDVKLLRDEERITASTFLDTLSHSAAERPTVVDVREEFEVELGPKIAGSINIPMSKILRTGNSNVGDVNQADELYTVWQDPLDKPIYFICQRGNDSQIAAKKLSDKINDSKGEGCELSSAQRRWIGDVKGGFLAVEKLTQPG